MKTYLTAAALLILAAGPATAQRQIADYNAASSVARSDKMLLQQGAHGTLYTYGTPAQLFASMLAADVTAALGYTPVNTAAVGGAYASVGATNQTLSAWLAYLAGTVENPNNMTGAGYTTGITIPPGGVDAGFFNSPGSTWTAQWGANWNVVQSTTPYNPTEWQIYTNAAQGIATSQSGTNQVVGMPGSAFQSSWVGLPYFYFAGVLYKVASVTDATHLTMTTPAGGAVSFGSTATDTFYFLTTSSTSTCNVSGTAVSWVSGPPFIAPQQAYINGTSVTATFVDVEHLTLSASLGTLTNATCALYENINNELATLRLQGLGGGSEENFTIQDTPAYIWIGTQYAGNGKYRPVKFMNGENPAGTLEVAIATYPGATVGQPGTILIGGDFATNDEVFNIAPNYLNVNYWYAQGGPTGSGPSFAARGADTNVGWSLDMQGAATGSFTSHSYGNTEFQIFGSGAADYLAVASGGGFGQVIAQGSDTNVGVKLVPKGTGNVIVSSGAIQLPQTTPANSSATCTAGAIYADASYLYACTATNTWKRAALSSF